MLQLIGWIPFLHIMCIMNRFWCLTMLLLSTFLILYRLNAFTKLKVGAWLLMKWEHLCRPNGQHTIMHGSQMFSLSCKLKRLRDDLQTWCISHKKFKGLDWKAICAYLSRLGRQVSNNDTASSYIQSIQQASFRWKVVICIGNNIWKIFQSQESEATK